VLLRQDAFEWAEDQADDDDLNRVDHEEFGDLAGVAHIFRDPEGGEERRQQA
jgi:hypothetical protein